MNPRGREQQAILTREQVAQWRMPWFGSTAFSTDEYGKRLKATALHLYDENERLTRSLTTARQAVDELCAGVIAVENHARKALADAGHSEEEFCEANEGAA